MTERRPEQLEYADSNGAKFLRRSLFFHICVEGLVAILIAILQLIFAGFVDKGAGEFILWMVVVSIAISVAWGLWRHVRIHLAFSIDFSKFGGSLSALVPSFPLSTLLWDFVNLAVLVAVTNGVASMFLPLFVVGLIVSDMCADLKGAQDSEPRANGPKSSKQDWKPWAVYLIFLITASSAVVSAQWDPARCLMLTLGASPSCPDRLWVLPRWSETLVAAFIFIGSALFGSLVIRGYRKQLA